jgi:hypothetical protein
MQGFELLGTHRVDEKAYPGDVAAWLVEARDQAELDRVAANSDQNRNRRGAWLGGHRRRNSAHSDDQVHPALNQFCRKRWQPLIMLVSPAILEGDGTAFVVTTFGQSLPESIEPISIGFSCPAA